MTRGDKIALGVVVGIVIVPFAVFVMAMLALMVVGAFKACL